jgi:S-adenosylmethionine-diacylglycerol 3-amino-3-carboxypropyl transferase
MGIVHALNERVFRQIHGHNLVYNTCWEDPRCDRNLLQMGPDSRVLMITSAGCNALDYLLDDPAAIHCVDLNPRQNALLQLKMALFRQGSHDLLFDFFGVGHLPDAREHFQALLASGLLPDAAARRYWQQHLHYFNGKGLRRSFYWHGSSGAAAWLVQQWLQSKPKALRMARMLFEAPDLEAQRAAYAQFEPHFLNKFVRWLVSQHVLQSMLGVPKSQQHLAAHLFKDGMAGYVRHCLRHVFTTLPLADNYFWKLYFYGRYTPDCCPNYLRAAHFETLRDRVGRISTHSDALSGFLQQHPGQYTHFVLLDHQDWLAARHRQALAEEWRLILANAAPGAKVLLRSASFQPDFLPAFVLEKMRLDPQAAAAEHAKDRVGTYASTLIGTIQP